MAGMTVAGMIPAARVVDRGDPAAAATTPREMAAADVAAACEVGAATTGMATTATAPSGVSRAGGEAGCDDRSRSCETKDDFA
jgi:hypothetical protein